MAIMVRALIRIVHFIGVSRSTEGKPPTPGGRDIPAIVLRLRRIERSADDHDIRVKTSYPALTPADMLQEARFGGEYMRGWLN
jgi:hypothetical protein